MPAGGGCQWGLVGKLLNGEAEALLLADFAIVLSSDMRGPFLPSYHQVSSMNYTFVERQNLAPVVLIMWA